MALMNKKELTQLTEQTEVSEKYKGLPERVAKLNSAVDHIVESLQRKELRGEDFSIRDLVETLITDKSGNAMGSYLLSDKAQLSESNAQIASLDGFSRINGQIFYNRVREQFDLAEYSVHKLFDVIPSNVIDRPEQFAGVSALSDAALEVEDGQTFPTAGPTQIFTTAPRQKIFGLMTGVTWAEAQADRTGQILRRMDSVAEALARKREKRAIDLVIDAAVSVGQRYKYKDVSYATYQSSATNFGAVNAVPSNGLVNPTNLNNAYIALSTMVDPETGEPIAGGGNYTLLTTPQLAYKAKQLAVMSQLRTGTTATNDTINIGTSKEFVSPCDFNVVSSKYLTARLTADSTRANTEWYFGDFKKAFSYVRAADISTQAADPLSGTLFSNNLLGLWRSWFREECFVWEPRNMTKNVV